MYRRLIICGMMLATYDGFAQQFSGEEAWKTLLEHEGLRFRYIFYPEADSNDDGVVVMLQNLNEYCISYRFTLIFESPEGSTTADAEGTLASLEMKTGSADGLFWIPFDDGRSIGAIGLRNYAVDRITVSDQSSETENGCP
jgi:hypothetical protein